MTASGRPGQCAGVRAGRRALATLAVLLSCTAQANPVADDAAVVIDGNARFTVLTSQLLRMEWSEDGTFEDRASLTFINRHLPVPDYDVAREGGWLTLQTAGLTLRYRRDSGEFGDDNLQVTFRLAGKQRTWTPASEASGNLRGTVRTVDGYEGRRKLADGSVLQLGPGLLSRDGWSLVDDSSRPLFDGEPSGNRVSARAAGNRQDWYLFAHGRDYRAALGDFVAVAGRIPMPPRYAFGYWWSRYWAYSDAELRELVHAMRDYDIPLDVLIVDMDWHETHGLTSKEPRQTPFGGMLGWTGYTWNRDLFPEPERFLDWTADQGLKVALNLHPADGIAPFEEDYPAMRDALGELAPPDGDWIPYRMSDPDWSRAYFDAMLRPHERIGVDFWWIDWQQWPESRHVAGLSNTFWLNHVFFTDMQREYPGRRPLLFHRWGGLGNHRYQVGFSGDAVISWDSLAFQPAFTATASNVAYGYWSHDIGGHIDAHDDLAASGELYLRWLQYGALSPILRTHSSKSDVAERRIWRYPEHFEAMRAAIRLRYRLVPYLYNAAREAYDTGVSVTRPMYYAYPQRERAYELPGQYLLGDDLLAAPVTAPVDADSQLATVELWLPPGRWYETDTGRLLEGGRMLRRTVALDEIPLYARAGSIVPTLPAGTASLQRPAGRTVLTIYPGEDDRIEYYEDDGRSQAYKDAGYATTPVSTTHGLGGLRLTIGAAQGDYEGMPAERRFRLRLPGVLPADSVTVGGKLLHADALHYDAEAVALVIELPPLASDASMTVDIAWRDGPGIDRLSGLAGRMRRLAELVARAKRLSARDDWAATLPDELLRLASTPTRISYEPARLAEVAVAFDRRRLRVRNLLASMPQIAPAEADALAAYLDFGVD